MFLRVFNQPIPSIHLKICDPKSEIIPQRSSNLKSKNLQISKSPNLPLTSPSSCY